MGYPAGPGDGQIAVGEAQLSHQVHGPIGQPNLDHGEAHFAQCGRYLRSTLGVCAQTARQQYRPRVQPGCISALERPRAANAAQNGYAQFREAPGHETLLAGAHSRGGPAQEHAFWCHEEQVGDEHQVGWRHLRGVQVVHRNPECSECFGEGHMLLARKVDIQGLEHVCPAGFGHSLQFRAGLVQQHLLEGRPLTVGPAVAPNRSDFLPERGRARRPARTAIRGGDVGFGHVCLSLLKRLLLLMANPGQPVPSLLQAGILLQGGPGSLLRQARPA